MYVRNNYGRRGFRGRRGGGRMRLNTSMPFLAGAVVGFTNLDDKIPPMISLAAATMPISGGGVGKIKAAAQGVVFGNLLQSFMGRSAGVTTGQFFGI